MKAVSFAGVGVSIGVMSAVAVYAQNETTATGHGLKSEVVADATGNLRVPDDYHTTYQFLGSWAVASDQGHDSKELHLVYASPGTIAAYRNDGRFPDGAGAGERGVSGRH
jgi:hypothetical protein